MLVSRRTQQSIEGQKHVETRERCFLTRYCWNIKCVGVGARRVMLAAGSGMVWQWGAMESYGAEMSVIGSACKMWQDFRSQLKP